MASLRSKIENALDEIVSYEEGMRFQSLAVVLGKMHWPKLIACQRKKDLGLDAYASSSLTGKNYGKGLAAAITPTLNKISSDVSRAKENFPDLKKLLFVTLGKVTNLKQKQWQEAILNDHDVELHIIGREEVIAQMMMPGNAHLGASFLNLTIDPEPTVAELINKTRRAAAIVTRRWAERTRGHPLIELSAMRLDAREAESVKVLSLEQIDQVLSQSWRVVLEAPAGRGKTTTLIQLAQRVRHAGIAFLVEIPAWTSSGKGILEYIAGMPAFQAEGLTPSYLARVQQTEPFLLLLNGCNEISESSSAEAVYSLRELERDFPSAGIIVATRAHHIAPPLPGAWRLRLLRLKRVQRATYLAERLGAGCAELRARMDAAPPLDELTRTPFILSEVATLFEGDFEIPTTKMGILAEVLRLHEQRDEHRHALQAAPIFGLQLEYLKALAAEMTRCAAVSLTETVARAVVARVGRELTDRGQIEQANAPAVLATLTAHHILERVEYPETMFRFEHQQLQEYCAALDVHTSLLELSEDDIVATDRFTADCVNIPAWAEALRMIGETLAEKTGDERADKQNRRAGSRLIAMAITVDLVFAGELARLCGSGVWNEVRAEVGERLRATYAIPDGNYKQYALAAMLATGTKDFRDIVLPLLSGADHQARIGAYRLWPDIRLSSLGSNWREEVRGWSEEARADFVSELLHHRVHDEIASFAAEDCSTAVKEAAASGLMWTGSDSCLTVHRYRNAIFLGKTKACGRSRKHPCH